VQTIDEIIHDPVSRRAFLRRMTAAGLGTAATVLLATQPGALWAGGSSGGDPNFPGIPGRNIDEIVLNFALTLENLEADLYRQALNKATGRPRDARLLPFRDRDDYELEVDAGDLTDQAAEDGFLFLVEFTYVEAAHRDFLTAAIKAGGGTPVPPNPKGYQFATPLKDNLESILSHILPLEETGVRAYLGALPFFDNYKVLGPTAGGIFSTEARHSAVISNVLGIDPGPRKMAGDQQVTPNQPSENTFEYVLAPKVVIQRVQPMIIK
jgi:hypothetical protein